MHFWQEMKMRPGLRSFIERAKRLAQVAATNARVLIGRVRITLLYDWRFKPDHVCRDLPRLGVKINVISFVGDDECYKVFSVPGARMMSDGQHTVAIIAGNSLVPEPSFHQPRWVKPAPPPEKNPMLTWGRVPGTLRHVRGVLLSLLSDLDGGSNYYHWMVDVLPRLHLAEKAGVPPTNINFYVAPDTSLRYQIETLDLMKIAPDARISARAAPHIAADTLIVTTHPCPDLYDVPAWVVSWLREAFLRNDSERELGRLVYVDRSDVGRRRLLNEDECYSLVLQPLGFERYRLSEMSFTDQVRLFSGADVIVGCHGAGLVNLAFCRRGTKVLELFGAWQVPVFQAISRARGLQYSALVSTNYQTDFEPRHASFSINLQEVANALNLLRV